MAYTIDNVVILGNGNLQVTYTLDGEQNTKEIDKEKICNCTVGTSMSN